jgi:hypothetical protein
LFRRHSFASAEREEGAIQFRLESLKSGFGQVLPQIRNLEDTHIFTSFHQTGEGCIPRHECCHRQGRTAFHGSCDFAQSEHSIGEEMEGSAADYPIEDSVLEWQFLYAGPGEADAGYALPHNIGHSLL